MKTKTEERFYDSNKNIFNSISNRAINAIRHGVRLQDYEGLAQLSTTQAPLEDQPGFKELASNDESPYRLIESEEIMRRINELEIEEVDKECAAKRDHRKGYAPPEPAKDELRKVLQLWSDIFHRTENRFFKSVVDTIIFAQMMCYHYGDEQFANRKLWRLWLIYADLVRQAAWNRRVYTRR